MHNKFVNIPIKTQITATKLYTKGDAGPRLPKLKQEDKNIEIN